MQDNRWRTRIPLNVIRRGAEWLASTEKPPSPITFENLKKLAEELRKERPSPSIILCPSCHTFLDENKHRVGCKFVDLFPPAPKEQEK